MKSSKDTALLLNPLQRIAAVAEASNALVSQIHAVLTVDLKKAAVETHKELKKQTAILGDIRELIKELKDKEKGGKGGVKMPSMAGAVAGGFAIVVMAGALVMASGLLGIMATPSAGQLITAIAIGFVFQMLAPVFASISAAMTKSMGEAIVGKMTGGSVGVSDGFKTAGVMVLTMVGMAAAVTLSSWIFTMIIPITFNKFISALAIAVVMIPISYAAAAFMKGMRRAGISMNMKGLKRVAILPLVMAAVSMGIVAAAYAFQLLPSKFTSPPVEWSLKVGLALFVFSFSFSMIAKAASRLGVKGLAAAALAIPILALGILAAAWILQLLPSTFLAPPAEWSLKAGLAIAVFSIGFALVAYAAKKLGVKGLLLGLLGVVAVSIGILATAWIFSVLPGTFIAPPMEWSLNAAISILLFSIPMAVIGGLAMLLTPVGLLLGAVGMILIAGVIWVVAWIFSKLPEVNVGALDKLSRGLMSPMHAMIDVLKRFKDEIGIGEMLPLAGGIIAIAGAWLALTAAVAGQAVGGVFAAAGNLISGGLSKLGSMVGIKKKAETPFDILKGLAKHASTIMKLGKPLGNIAAAMSVKGLGPFLDAMKSVKSLARDRKSLAPIPGTLNGISNAFQNIGYHAAALKAAFRPLHHLMGKTAMMIKLSDHLKIVAEAYREFAASSKEVNVQAVVASTRMFNALSRLAGIAQAMVMVQNAVASISAHSERFIEALSPISKLAEAANQKILRKSAMAVSSISRSFFNIMETADSIGVGDVFLTSQLFDEFRQLAILSKPIETISKAFTNISKQSAGIAAAIEPLAVFFDRKNATQFRHSAISLDKMQRSYGKIANHTRKINVEAVDASTRMFTALADLAKAEGDSVMKVLAEELFKATKELGEVVVRLEEAVDEQTKAVEGSGNVVVDTIKAFKNMVTANTEQAKENAETAAGTQEVRVVNLDNVVAALNQVEDRLGLPLTVSIEED